MSLLSLTFSLNFKFGLPRFIWRVYRCGDYCINLSVLVCVLGGCYRRAKESIVCLCGGPSIFYLIINKMFLMKEREPDIRLSNKLLILTSIAEDNGHWCDKRWVDFGAYRNKICSAVQIVGEYVRCQTQ